MSLTMTKILRFPHKSLTLHQRRCCSSVSTLSLSEFETTKISWRKNINFRMGYQEPSLSYTRRQENVFLTNAAKSIRGFATTCDNYIGGRFVLPQSGKYLDVMSPQTNEVIGKVALSNDQDVQCAVEAAEAVRTTWAKETTIKARAAHMLKLHGLIRDKAQELAELIVKENGKNITEALADVAKGNETVEYACSLPQLAQGRTLQVSGDMTVCRDRRDPLGVVASIVPFNFPLMVPMWTVSLATVLGNCMILKPSEKVPLTMTKVMELVEEAGFPPGVIQLVHGQGSSVVNPLMDHPSVKAVTFVGSSPVAKLVADRCRSLNKRVLALGGAKNHLVVLDDCNVDQTSSDITVSFAGCAGQRCMAASVLLFVGEGETQQRVLNKVIENAKAIPSGCGAGQLGPVIDKASYDKIQSYIKDAEDNGADILLDGRQQNSSGEGGYWVGPTIIHHKSSSDKAMKEEIFGPVLSVYNCQSWEEALDIENSNEFGNAAAVYTTNGYAAEYFCNHFRTGMMGVNIGIPVPREPFSFGGLYGTRSKYGDMDMTGDNGIEFFTNRIKITSRWPMVHSASEPSSKKDESSVDHAHFSGRM